MTRCVIFVLALAGCDQVFGLDRPDAAPLAIDAPPDAPACKPGDHDEDLDGIPDLCDPCPAIPNTSGDLDGDGIDDACDPDPEVPDRRLAFFGFDTVPNDLRLLIEGTGSWTTTNDQLVLDSSSPAGDYLARFGDGLVAVYLETRVTIVFAGPPSGSRSVGLWTQIDPQSLHPAYPTGVVFELLDFNAQRLAHIVETFTLDTNASQPDPSLFASGVSYTLRLRCLQALGLCQGTADAGGTAVHVMLGMTAARPGSVGLRAHGDLRAAFDYLSVYALGGS